MHINICKKEILIVCSDYIANRDLYENNVLIFSTIKQLILPNDKINITIVDDSIEIITTLCKIKHDDNDVSEQIKSMFDFVNNLERYNCKLMNYISNAQKNMMLLCLLDVVGLLIYLIKISPM